MFETILGQLVVMAAFVERGVQFVKTITKYNAWAEKYQGYIDQVLTVGGSAGLCLAWNLDIFAVADISIGAAPWVGSVLTGVVAGLGGNILHELIELLKMWRQGPTK